jgi:heme O synthase-like polyprenyltransferase
VCHPRRAEQSAWPTGTPAGVQLFGYSIVYLALLFGAMVADRVLM